MVRNNDRLSAFIDSTPRWSGSAFAEYHPPILPALGLNAGVYYTGKRFTDVQDQGTLPAYATLSLGTSYKVAMPSGHAPRPRLAGPKISRSLGSPRSSIRKRVMQPPVVSTT